MVLGIVCLASIKTSGRSPVNPVSFSVPQKAALVYSLKVVANSIFSSGVAKVAAMAAPVGNPLLAAQIL
jgi:hypothetical protein